MNSGLFRNLFSVLNLFGWLFVVAVIPGVCSLTLNEVRKNVCSQTVNEEIVVFTIPCEVKAFSLPLLLSTPPAFDEFSINKRMRTAKEIKTPLMIPDDVKGPSMPSLSLIRSYMM